MCQPPHRPPGVPRLARPRPTRSKKQTPLPTPPRAEPQPSARAAAEGRRVINRAAESGTSFLVSLATLCFAWLLAPQLWQNAAALAAGKGSVLAALSPAGAAAAFTANAALLVRFLGLQESGAATVQAVGVAANGVLLSQLAQAGMVGTVGPGVCLAVTAAVLCAAATKAVGALDVSATGERVWRTASAIIGIVAVTAVPACLAASAGAGAPVPLVAGAVAALLASSVAAVHVLGWLRPAAARAAASAPAWAATTLFILQPLAQAAVAVRVARSAAAGAAGSGAAAAASAALGGLAPATLALAALGNGLCIPRALLTRDAVWAVGTVWGCTVGGWGPLLGLALLQARAAGGGLPAAPLASAVAMLTGTLITVVGGGLVLVWRDGMAGAELARRK